MTPLSAQLKDMAKAIKRLTGKESARENWVRARLRLEFKGNEGQNGITGQASTLISFARG
ncbi:MAG TPA: hypothetical protein VMQ73_12920 [Methylomirabilota bacterium]|nr:hypothetical protein [Methylomirabilota bacterium]